MRQSKENSSLSKVKSLCSRAWSTTQVPCVPHMEIRLGFIPTTCLPQLSQHWSLCSFYWEAPVSLKCVFLPSRWQNQSRSAAIQAGCSNCLWIYVSHSTPVCDGSLSASGASQMDFTATTHTDPHLWKGFPHLSHRIMWCSSAAEQARK